MEKYSQANRPLSIETPLGQDALLLTQLQGQEGLSQLFEFKVDLLAPTTEPVVFDQILGASVTIQLNIPGSSKRCISGIVNSFTQGERVRGAEGQVAFLRYQASVVPRLWLLTRRSQSRIFLDLSVPDILLEILKKEWQLDVVARITEHFDPRIRCVQYRETDFAFVSRLMEEEGLHYFFEHTDKGHRLVLSDAKAAPASLPEPGHLRYTEQEGNLQEVGCIYHWKKTQLLQACKVTLWDHCFELPGQHLEADTEIETSVSAGKAKHKLNLQQTINGVAMLENYDYPGRYAQRYDGINSNGAEQASSLPKIFDDNKRTTQIRAQQEAVQALTIQGTSNLGHLVPGTQFKLEHHFDADDSYLLTQVTHHASIEGTYLGTDHVDLQYKNEFTCLPLTLPYRPPSVTPRPTVKGSQTATVVGPEGQVVYCDKYGRIKVQFHWDRTKFKGGSSKHILHNSSGWIRVSQAWAGQSFGSIFLPRIGQEVVVDFLEGDPDRPIVTGSVYNAEQMPPFELPDYQTHSGLRTRSRDGDDTEFSQLTFEDFKGGEHVHLHSQRDMTHSTENDLVQNIAQAHRVNIGSMGVRQVGALPGVDHSYWIGKDNPVGAVPSSDSSKGSGSGGGESGPFYSISPSDLSKGWAGDLDIVLGWHTGNTLGLYTTLKAGVNQSTTINPFALNDLFPAMSTAGGVISTVMSGLTLGPLLRNAMGAINVVIGSNVGIYYGRQFDYKYGPAIFIRSNWSTRKYMFAAIAGALYTSAVLMEVFLPAIYSSNHIAGEGIMGVTIAVDLLAFNLWAMILQETWTIGFLTMSEMMVGSDVNIVPSTSLPFDGDIQALGAIAANVPHGPEDSSTDQSHWCESTYTIGAPLIRLISDPSTDSAEGPLGIVIQAKGLEGTDGEVVVYGTGKASLIGGDQASVQCKTLEEVEGQITIDCGAEGTINLQSGLTREPNNLLLNPEGIAITSALQVQTTVEENSITLNPAEIALAAGLSSINMTPEGITLSCGPCSIAITPEGITISGPTVTLSGDATVSISSAAVSIGP